MVLSPSSCLISLPHLSLLICNMDYVKFVQHWVYPSRKYSCLKQYQTCPSSGLHPMSQDNTFPNFLRSQLFPFFTLPCPFLSIVEKNTLSCHMSLVQLFSSADSCQVLGSSLSIASRGLFTKIVCRLLPEVLTGKEGSPLVSLDACLSLPRHWGPLENRDDEKN